MFLLLSRRLPALIWGLVALSASIGYGNSFVQLDYNLTLAGRSRSTVFIELFDDRPLTRDNFLQYVNAGLYDGSFMHRLSRNFVLQGGGFYPTFQSEPAPLNVSLNPNAVVDLDGNAATPNPTILNEFGNSPFRSNLKGTLAMAKVGGNPNSATNQWFVNLGNNAANLDNQNGGFTVFARVVGDGMSGYFDILNSGLQIINLNQDANNDLTRDSGPFGNPPVPPNPMTDGVPVIPNTLTLAVLDRATRVDYYGAGSSVNVPGGGLTFSTRDVFIDTGATFGGTGTITVDVNRALVIRENISLGRPLVNRGIVAPGMQLGSVTVPTYQQTGTGTLSIQLRGTTANTEYDQLLVSGNAQLAGKLDVSLLNLYQPVHGNTFNVLLASSISGAFANVELPFLTAGLVWNYRATSTAITLGVAAADFNKNGVADAADYAVWRDMFGRTGAGLAADANGDMVVNAADLAIWRSNFGNTRGNVLAGSGSATAVPEPSSLALAALGILLAVRFASRRRTR
ncbi:MAG: peptidylprolyl isomerase [Pirellulales bacterium]